MITNFLDIYNGKYYNDVKNFIYSFLLDRTLFTHFCLILLDSKAGISAGFTDFNSL